MKKVFLFMVAVLFSAVVFSQSLGNIYIYKNANSKFSKQLLAGSIVYLRDSAACYLLKDVGGSRNTLNGMIDSSDVQRFAQWTFGSLQTFPGDTTTAVLRAIVFMDADSSFYGCRSTVAVKKWYKLN